MNTVRSWPCDSRSGNLTDLRACGARFDLERASESFQTIELDLALLLLQQTVPAPEEGVQRAVRSHAIASHGVAKRGADLRIVEDGPSRVEEPTREDRSVLLVEDGES